MPPCLGTPRVLGLREPVDQRSLIMRMEDPYCYAMDSLVTLNALEAALRSLVREVMGAGWRTLIKTPIQELEARRDSDKGRRGVVHGGDLLEYTDFVALSELILKNWEPFAAALGKKKEFEAYCNTLRPIRNSIAHSRALVPFEESLLAGIAGDLQNRIVKYRSEQSVDNLYYPDIEAVTDSLGQLFEVLPGSGIPQSTVRLNVGDVLTFRCRASDPQNRELRWTFSIPTANYRIGEATGNSCEFQWGVTKLDVGESAYVRFELASSGPYHRHQTVDRVLQIQYAVNPPIE